MGSLWSAENRGKVKDRVMGRHIVGDEVVNEALVQGAEGLKVRHLVLHERCRDGR